MATPNMPTGLKPVIQGYNMGSPEGVDMTPVMGGMPRVGLTWDRGVQPFHVTLILTADKYFIWNTFFIHSIKKGSIQFTMPLDSDSELADHLCMMVPESYSAGRAGGQVWAVAFTVLAENRAYEMSADEAQSFLDLWEESGDDLAPLLERIEQFANFELTVPLP